MKHIRQRLIISADDFGLSPEANSSILKLAESGRLDRVAVMPEGEISMEEVLRLKRSGVALDIHLDIPVLNTGMRNSFLRSIFFVQQYIFGKLSADVVGDLWERQIELFKKKFGRHPDGINSHQHVHFFPPYFRKSLLLAQKFHISFFRFGRESILIRHGLASSILRFFHNIQRKDFVASGLASSDFLISLDWIKKPQEFLRSSIPGTTEIVCHPEIKKEAEMIEGLF